MTGWDSLPDLFPQFARPDRWAPLLRRHAGLLAASPVRATAVTDAAAVTRHYAESLESFRLAGAPEEGAVVDVGSGGGFPGLVVAAVAPALEVHLVEARRRRAELLAALAEALGLARVTVHAARAEEAGRGPLRDGADLVLARAVAPLPVLLEYCAPLAAPGALVAAVKGSRGEAELARSGAAMSALACEFAGMEAMRAAISPTMRVLRFRKLGPTPARWPRRPGMPAKRPIAAP